jgi:hypothetical protein
MRWKKLPVALPFLMLAALAFAQDVGTPSASPTPGVPPPGATGQDASLRALDADRDGTISMQEANRNQTLSGQFLTLDRNGNGALEPAEFARFEAGGTAPNAGSTTPPAGGATPGVTGTTSGTSRTGTSGTMAPSQSPTPSPTGTESSDQTQTPSSGTTPRQ